MGTNHPPTPAVLCGHRRSIRLTGWDYAGDAVYFVTIGTYRHRSIFAAIEGGKVRPTRAGGVVVGTWASLRHQFPGVTLYDFVLMPNHMHGIIRLRRGGPALGRVLGAFKSRSASQIQRAGLARGRVWERNYYERVVRDRAAFETIRRYIALNPIRWQRAHHPPQRTPQRTPPTHATNVKPAWGAISTPVRSRRCCPAVDQKL